MMTTMMHKMTDDRDNDNDDDDRDIHNAYALIRTYQTAPHTCKTHDETHLVHSVLEMHG